MYMYMYTIYCTHIYTLHIYICIYTYYIVIDLNILTLHGFKRFLDRERVEWVGGWEWTRQAGERSKQRKIDRGGGVHCLHLAFNILFILSWCLGCTHSVFAEKSITCQTKEEKEHKNQKDKPHSPSLGQIEICACIWVVWIQVSNMIDLDMWHAYLCKSEYGK